MLHPLTYDTLFSYLESIGFEDRSPSEFERVFKHLGWDILLIFSMMDDPDLSRPVREVDLTSTETRLAQHQLLLKGTLTESLEFFVRQ